MHVSGKETMAKNTVSHNPAMVEFPSDEYGFTSTLREAGLRTASNINGSPEKHRLYMDTLRVLAGHAQARLEIDANEQQLEAMRIAKRDAAQSRRQASHGAVTPDVPQEAPAEPAEEPSDDPV